MKSTILFFITDEADYDTVKAVSEKALLSFIQKVDEKIDGSVRAQYLDTKLTADAYTKVTSTYPLGCRRCTMMNHSEDDCTVDLTKKRQRSNNDDDTEPPAKVTAVTS